MGRFSRAELEEAVTLYEETAARCSETGDWAPYADIFTEDVLYEEHAYGDFRSREEVRAWIVDVMKPFPHMRFPHEWVAYDEENGAVVLGIMNLLDHPTEPGKTFWFPNVTRLTYAGGGLFSREEDVYNPVRDAARVITEWIQAGGRLETIPDTTMKHAAAVNVPRNPD
ncbi:nuclear transport factor 2 family protein [Mycobacteriaceae bacterium NPDC060252]